MSETETFFSSSLDQYIAKYEQIDNWNIEWITVWWWFGTWALHQSNNTQKYFTRYALDLIVKMNASKNIDKFVKFWKNWKILCTTFLYAVNFPSNGFGNKKNPMLEIVSSICTRLQDVAIWGYVCSA